MTIRIERHEAQAVSRLTLERADRGNSLSAQVVAELAAALDTSYRDGTRLLLIDAAGPNFCTGFDLSPVDYARPAHSENDRQPLLLETSVPGVFAIGDARAGSAKRVAAAVGEGAAVVAQVHAWLASHEAMPANHGT